VKEIVLLKKDPLKGLLSQRWKFCLSDHF